MQSRQLNSIRLPAAFLLIYVLSGPALAATYYVAATGSDRNSGISWSDAWRTLQHAATRAMPGDEVIIRKSPVPYHHMRTIRSGTQSSPIVFRGENRDDPPVISGAIPASKWAPSNHTGVWKFRDPGPGIVKRLKEDNLTLQQASTEECRDGAWYWQGGMLYYRPSSGIPARHKVWRNKDGGILVDGHSWIVISGITLDAGMGSGISIRNGKHNILKHFAVSNHWRGVTINNGSYNTVEDCLVKKNAEGIYIENNSSHNIVRRCIAMHNGNKPAFTKGDRHAIAIGGTGINRRNTVEDCEIAFNGGPPDTGALVIWQGPGSIVSNNHVHHNYGSGIAVTVLSDNSSIVGNNVDYNGKKAVSHGEKGVFGITVRGSKHVEVIGNTLHGNHVSANSRYGTHIQPGARGAIDIREAGSRLDMRGITVRGNTVTDTHGGPDLAVSDKPDLMHFDVDMPVTRSH